MKTDDRHQREVWSEIVPRLSVASLRGLLRAIDDHFRRTQGLALRFDRETRP